MAKPAKQEQHLASHAFNVAVFVVGAVALVFMMEKLGWDTARRVFAGVGGWFFVAVAFDVGALALEAAAIHSFMRPEARMVRYLRILAAQASGRAINILTPGGALGEATKITMLVASAPKARVVSSIVLLNLAGFYLSVTIVVIGVPVAALLVDLPHELEIAVWTGLAVLVPLVVLLGIVIQRGTLSTALSAARFMHMLSPERAAKWKERLQSFDRHVRELESNRSPGTRRGLVFVLAARACSWTATTIVLYSVGVQIGFSVLAGVFSIGVLIGWISAFVPFGMGIADGGNYALFSVLGASGAQGVFVTLISRARSLTLALLGLFVMAAGQVANRLEVARRNRLMARLEGEHGSESLARSG